MPLGDPIIFHHGLLPKTSEPVTFHGLEKFDKNLLPMGSDAEDHVVLLGGGSGHGKSAVMRQIAGVALRRQQTVLNYTRETSVKGWIRQLAFAASMWAGVYLCLHDFPTLGGFVCILTLFANWGFEHEGKS